MTLEPGLRDALAHDRLRRRDEQERLLEPAAVVDEALLLDHALGVVPGVDLVRGEHDDVGRRRQRVGVDDDAAASAPEVVVERPPGLVVDLLDDQLLALRQLDEVCDPGAEDLDRREQRGHHLRRGTARLSRQPSKRSSSESPGGSSSSSRSCASR